MFQLRRMVEGEIDILTIKGHFLPCLLVDDPQLFSTEREANEWKTIHGVWDAYTHCQDDNSPVYHTVEDETFAHYEPSNLESVSK